MAKRMTKPTDETADRLVAFAARLNAALDRLNIPKMGEGRQAAASRLFGRNPKAIQRWLDGEGMPQRKDWPLLASKLGMSVEELVWGLPRQDVSLAVNHNHGRELMKTVMIAVEGALERTKTPMTKEAKAELVIALCEALEAENGSHK